MSVAKKIRQFGIRHCALWLGCLLAQQSVLARSDRDPVLFHAASLQGADTRDVVVFATREQQRAFAPAPFLPAGDAATMRARIAELEEAGDFYSPRMAEFAADLGKALQESGDHRAALDAYDRAFQIMRRHEGLQSVAQASVLEARIESLIALGDMAASDELHQSLLLMQQQVLAGQPVALAAAHYASADWNLNYYFQLAQAAAPGGRTELEQKALAERLATSFMQYHEALRLLSTAAEAGHYDDKVAIERKIAALTLMVNRQYQRSMPNTLTKLGQNSVLQSKTAHHPALLRHGSAALQRAVDYGVATAEPVLVAERQLELADWYLLMDQHDQARATYDAAMVSLRDAGIDDAQIAAILESGLPVRDPEAALQASTTEDDLSDFDGYIDVAFDLNRYGKATNTRVIAGVSYDEGVEADLLRQIHDGRFRPGFEQGAVGDSKEVTLRYYFAR